ncbi:MAG: hypothetical protein KF767_03540 [Bdellovibrionaceae bacterium]|nr:hypothetical protein [Pseudobdellovibrionaceae bacterium]
MKWQLALTCLAVFFALGCTQGSPTISATEELPPIILDRDTFEARSLELYDLTFSGRVSKLVSSLEVSMDNGGSWIPLENTPQSSFKIDLASCSSHCQFSYDVSNVGQRWSRLMQMQHGDEVTGLLRGRSNFGLTTPTIFKLKRVVRGFFAVGSIGLNRLGGKVKTLSGGFSVQGGKLESQPIRAATLTDGTTSVQIQVQGVVQ